MYIIQNRFYSITFNALAAFCMSFQNSRPIYTAVCSTKGRYRGLQPAASVMQVLSPLASHAWSSQTWVRLW